MDLKLTRDALLAGTMHSLVDFDVLNSNPEAGDNPGQTVAKGQAALDQGQFAEAADAFLKSLVAARLRSIPLSDASVGWKYALCRARVYEQQGFLSGALEYQHAALDQCSRRSEEALVTHYLSTLLQDRSERESRTVRQLVEDLDVESLPPASIVPWALVRLLTLQRRCLAGAISVKSLKVLLEKVGVAKSLYEDLDQAYEVDRRLADDHNRRLDEVAKAVIELLRLEPPGLSELHNIAEPLIRVIRTYGKCYAAPDQRDLAYDKIVSVLRQILEVSDQSENLVQVTNTCAQVAKSIETVPGRVTTLLLLPVTVWIKHLLEASLSELNVHLEVGPGRKFLPLHKIGSSLEAALEISNRGTGIARDIEIACSPAKALQAEVEIMESPETLSPGAHRRLLLKIVPKESCTALDLEVLAEWRNPDQSTDNAAFSQTVFGQQWAIGQDWLRLRGHNPYPLSWIEDPTNLRGRSAILERLLRGVRNKELLRVYGEKRVGKTSIARVLEALLRDSTRHPRYLPIYLEWGRINRRSGGEVGESICSAALESFQKTFGRRSRLTPPDISEFREQVGPAAQFLERLAEEEQLDRVVLILDDCEYMKDLDFLKGDEGNRFLQSLKSLANTRGLVLLMIGSEGFRHFFTRHMSSIVNIGDVVEVAYIRDPTEQRDLIISPSHDALRISDDAFDLIVRLSAGNPWFSNKICNEIYEKMVQREDGYVSMEEVLEVSNTIARERGLRGNFAHLWEESVPFDAANERHGSALSAAVMSAVSRYHSSPLEYAPERLVLQETKQYDVTNSECGRTLHALVAAGVLEEREGSSEKSYRIRVGLFHQWLRGIGRLELEPEFEELSATSEAEKQLRPNEAEILQLADRQWRRVDGRLIGSVEVESWLAGFEAPSRQRLAYKLLGSITYYDEVAVRKSLTNLFEAVKARLKKVRYSSKNVPLNIFVTYGDEEPRSGASVLRYLNQALGGAIRSGGPPKLKAFLEESGEVGEERAVVLVNDMIGSGNSARKEIETIISAVHECSPKDGRIGVYYIAVTGFQSAKESLSTGHTLPVQVLIGEPLLESDRAFSEDRTLFTPTERVECMRMCKEIGRELVGEGFALGYADSQALVVFRHTVPNNTLPIFWAKAAYQGKEWVPLFPRR